MKKLLFLLLLLCPISLFATSYTITGPIEANPIAPEHMPGNYTSTSSVLSGYSSVVTTNDYINLQINMSGGINSISCYTAGSGSEVTNIYFQYSTDSGSSWQTAYSYNFFDDNCGDTTPTSAPPITYVRLTNIANLNTIQFRVTGSASNFGEAYYTPGIDSYGTITSVVATVTPKLSSIAWWIE